MRLIEMQWEKDVRNLVGSYSRRNKFTEDLGGNRKDHFDSNVLQRVFSCGVAHTSKPVFITLRHGRGVLFSSGENTFGCLRKP